MRVSRKNINKNLESEIFKIFYQVIADINHPDDIAVVLNSLLGKNEITAAAKRLAIALYLHKKRTYQNIKSNLRVSSATVSAVDKIIKSTGINLAIKKAEGEEWASSWNDKIKNFFK